MSKPIEIRRSDHVGFTVPDLPQATTSFTDALGFGVEYTLEKVPYLSGGLHAHIDIVMLVHPTGQRVELLSYTNIAGRKDVPKTEDSGAAHLALAVTDVQHAATILTGQFGFQAKQPAASAPAGPGAVVTFQHLQTPWGLDIEIIQH